MSWFSRFLKRATQTKPRNRKQRRNTLGNSPYHRRLGMDFLEDRRLLSVVTDISDSASDTGSLRYQILNDAAGSTIQFASSLAGKTITLTSSTLTISKALTITGLGASLLTIDGGNAYTVFTLASNATATISGVTIAHGYTIYGDGGGIRNDGDLTLLGCNISDNQTLMGNGAGIYNDGNLTVSACTISGNSITSTGGPSGGGIYFEGDLGGSLTVFNCAFSNNVSESWGGAIYYDGSNNVVGSLAISNSTFSGNSSGYASGAAITVASAGNATRITTCTFSDNAGIAIVNTGSASTMAITASTISGNGSTSGGSDGGGIYNDFNCTLTLTDSTVQGNRAYDGGGIYNAGTLVADDSTIAQNSASDSSFGGGGGIYNNSSASVSLANTIVAGNMSGTSPDIYGTVTAEYCMIGSTLGASFSSSSASNYLGSVPVLAPLGPYGGPTMPDGSQMQTMPLLGASSAIDGGSNALIPSGLAYDQRGLAQNYQREGGHRRLRERRFQHRGRRRQQSNRGTGNNVRRSACRQRRWQHAFRRVWQRH